MLQFLAMSKVDTHCDTRALSHPQILGWFSYSRMAHTLGYANSLFTVQPLSYNRLEEKYKKKVKKTLAELELEVDEELAAERKAKGLPPVPSESA